MKKPEWFKLIEGHSPKRLLNATSKLENYAEELGRNVKYAVRVLDENANAGKGKYAKVLFPFIGETMAFPYLCNGLSKKEKALDYGIILGMGAVRTVGLALTVATGNNMPAISVYGGLTLGEELNTYIHNLVSNITPIELPKNNIIKTS